MPKTAASAARSADQIASLGTLLDDARTPVYVLDERRRIAYCNLALAEWLGLNRDQVLGRPVEFHSEPPPEHTQSGAARDRATPPPPPLTDLCPPPAVFAGHAASSLVACVGRTGRLVHRHARFFPLAPAAEKSSPNSAGYGAMRAAAAAGAACRATVAILDAQDVPATELARELSHDPSADELHRALRRFRRDQAAAHGASSLLGESRPMRKIRAQVAAAAASGANVLVSGPPGSGRGHVARAIHYASRAEAGGQLIPIDCRVATDDSLRRTLNSLVEDRNRACTVLLVDADQLPGELAAQIVEAFASGRVAARLIATVDRAAAISGPDGEQTGSDAPSGKASADTESATDPDEVVFAPPSGVDSRLVDLVSTITIHVPSLRERLEDLPLLVQAELEVSNQGNHKQIGRATSDAIDLLALHAWTGGLDELKRVIAAAHEACLSHEITPRDLPPVIHHAARAASRPARRQEYIVLDDFLAGIERELISRALTQSGGNKAEAARMLGMTRPRLYRRLVHLRMEEGNDEVAAESPLPDPHPG